MGGTDFALRFRCVVLMLMVVWFVYACLGS